MYFYIAATLIDELTSHGSSASFAWRRAPRTASSTTCSIRWSSTRFVQHRALQLRKRVADLLIRLQVCIFVKSVSRATELDRLLRECNFPSIAIHSGLAQDERIKRYQQFKAFEKRVLVATDIFGRGIDVERVNSEFAPV